MKKITDKMRLDWLQKNKPFAVFYRSAWGQWMIRNKDFSDQRTRLTLRQAIDSAIRKDKRKP